MLKFRQTGTELHTPGR